MGDGMPLLPARLPIVRSAGPWRRLFQSGRRPIHFGVSGDNRFDDPRGVYGVLYVAAAEFGACIETFGRKLDIRYVTRRDLERMCMARIEAGNPLRLVNLHGKHLARLGLDASIFAGPHFFAQSVSRALHDHSDAPDGIRYPCRHDDERFAVALFGDRSGAALTSLEVGTQRLRNLGSLAEVRNGRRLKRLLRHYRFGFRKA